MNPWHYLTVIIITVFSSIGNPTVAQCPSASLKPFSHIDISSIQVNELEINDAIAWQIQYWPKYLASDIIISDSIFDDYYIMNELVASTEYEIYIRNICEDDVSDWNGPFFEKTFIPGTSDCGIQLDIGDNNCPAGESFKIKIEGFENDILGDNVFLSNIKVIIQHDWPSDLRLTLVAPNGIDIPLSRDIGINRDNYGDPNDVNCQDYIRFDMSACQNIDQINENMIGSYIPIGDFEDFNGISPDGIWELSICDKAQGDIGQLNYVDFKFSNILCDVPQNIGIESISSTTAIIEWDNSLGCENIIIEYGPAGFISGTGTSIATECDITSKLIENLTPSTKYDFFIYTSCSNAQSPLSCTHVIETDCSENVIRSNFDNTILCEPSCLAICELSDDLWQNISSDDMDWIVGTGMTPSPQTGPEGDLLYTGNYIYIENSNSICSTNSEAILQSNCLQINASNDNCGLDFSYHMFGEDINELLLLISNNNLSEWDTLFIENEMNNTNWQKAYINLNAYIDQAVVLRFIAKSGSGDLGDIAVDNINLYNVTILQESLTYFIDGDDDGFGSSEFSIQYCSNIPPSGYVTNHLDCNDNDPNIHPGGIEIHCNLTDENCNGNEDDQPSNNPIQYSLDNMGTSNVFCEGEENGSIALLSSGGTGPYTYSWNTGDTTRQIWNLAEGTYMCTITDSEGCMLVTNPIHLGTSLVLNTSFIVDQPSCIGKEDGSIGIFHQGVPDFSYLWSNGATTKDLDSIVGYGEYWVKVTSTFNDNVCSEIDTIFVDAPQAIIYDNIIEDINCAGNQNGTIEIIPYSGTEPFTHLWEDGSTESVIGNLSPGPYKCTITDNEGCYNEIENLIVEEPDSLQVRIDAIDHVICNGQFNGRIEASTTGGNAPFYYKWNTGKFTNFIDSLPSGNFSLTITDNNGCTAEKNNIEIIEKPKITVTLDSLHPVSCPLSYDGYLSLDVEGGAGNFQYFWNHTTNNTPILENLLSSNYSVRIIDDFGCKKLFETEVPLLNIPLELVTELTSENLCHGDEIATINVQVNSGQAPYNYHWSTGAIIDKETAEDSITNLSQGQYQLTITDDEGCIGISESINLVEIMPLNFSLLELTQPSCYNTEDGLIEVQGIGGTSPYSYEWSNDINSPINADLLSGAYQFNIVDDNNCLFEGPEIQLDNPDKIVVEIEIDYNELNQKSSIRIQPISGVGPFHFIWNDLYQEDGFISERDFLDLQTYTINITDQNDCSIDTTITIEDIVSIESIQENKIIGIYPNPARNNIYIKNHFNQKIGKLIIKDLMGKHISSFSFDQSNQDEILEFSLEDISQNLILIEITDQENNLILIDKIVIIK